MNKKLFVVLVVVAAMLVTFSLVLAARKAVVDEPAPVRYEKPEYLDKQSAISVPEPGTVEKQSATLLKGTKQSASFTAAGPLTGEINRAGGKDFCDLYGSAAYSIGDWFWGLEYYANYQDPEEFGCTAVWPFLVADVGFNIIVDAAISIDVQGFVYNADWTVPDCPVPFMEQCATPLYTVDIPDAGHWAIGLPMTEECCVYEPYFAVIYIATDLYGSGADAVSEDNPTAVCRSYNDYGAGWEDLVAIYEWPGPMMLWSDGYVSPQNDCPTEGDTCGVTSVVPPSVSVLPGDAGVFTANVYFQGEQTECLLTVTPDPVCPSCVTTIVPNPVVDPATSATITIQTDASTPSGDYVFDVNGSKATATLTVVELTDSCEMARDNESWAWFWSGWVVGDMQLMYFDPEELCPGCGPDVYPFYVDAIKALIYNHQEAAYMDYIFHIYNSTGDPCDGPQEKMLSWEITNFDQWMTWTIFPLPEVLCVDGPFFFALEFNHDPGYYLPCALWTNQDYAFDCSQWVFQGGAFVPWEDMWTSPEGYMSLRAIGTCASEECPIVCDMQQDVGALAWYNDAFEEGDQVVKYYNPEDYCEPEVYPYKIHDLDLLFYDYASLGEIDVAVKVYLEVEDSCDGPGLQIYEYPVTITDFYGDMAHVVLDPQVCVYEPFYIGIEYLEGVPNTTPSLLFEDATVNPAEWCHVYFYKIATETWYEHYDFWGSPYDVGYPIIRVSGFTNHPDCEEEPCDTATAVLADYGSPTWIFAYPSTSGRDYVNQRFTLPVVHGGRLDEVRLAFYNKQGTPSPDVYVWWDDGNALPWDPNPPFGAIASFHIDNADVVTYPSYQIVETWPAGIHFAPGQEFHVGYAIDLSQTNDTLSHVFDDYTDPDQPYSDRVSAWWPGDPNYWETFLDHYGIYINMVMSAEICVAAPPGSTFVLSALPSLNYIAPGDADADLFDVTVTPIVGYALNVDLDIDPATLPAGVTYYYVPPGGTPEFTSDLYFNCAGTVSYGTYILTLRGTGADGQVKTKDVSLVVRPPYDEAMVPFYGTDGKDQNAQRATNFGAVGNDARDNFLWFGNSPLFDGSFIIATTDMDHMALDAYNCVFWGFVPDYHMILDDTSSAVAPYNAYRAFSEFGCDEEISGHIGVPGERDTVIIVGIDKADTVIIGDPPDTIIMPSDFSIKIKIYYTEGDPIEDMYISFFEDWDVGGGNNPYNNWVEIDPDHNLMWQYWPGEPNMVYGMFKAPFYDDPMYNMVAVRNHQYVWPCAGFCDWSDTDPEFYCLDSLYYYITRPGYFAAEMPDTDFSLLMTAGPITLTPGIPHIEIWVDFGRDLNDGLSWSQWWHRVLRYIGFYRGDVNASDMLESASLDISDLVYLINYLYKGGPEPHPFVDQGDVNRNNWVNSEDVVYLIDYLFKGGDPPWDCMRFIYPSERRDGDPWCRPSLFENSNWD